MFDATLQKYALCLYHNILAGARGKGNERRDAHTFFAVILQNIRKLNVTVEKFFPYTYYISTCIIPLKIMAAS